MYNGKYETILSSQNYTFDCYRIKKVQFDNTQEY